MEYYIYLPLKPYIRQWLTNAYGDPVKFDMHSIENAELKRWLRPTPPNGVPQVKKEGMTAIVIPQSKSRPASIYHYLTEEARDCLASMIRNTFVADLKSSVRRSASHGSTLAAATKAWMREHGIGMDHYETLIQIIQRAKKSYERRGISFCAPNNKKVGG